MKEWATANRGTAAGVLAFIWFVATTGAGLTIVPKYFENQCYNEALKAGSSFSDCSNAGTGPMWVTIIAVTVIVVTCGVILLVAPEE